MKFGLVVPGLMLFPPTMHGWEEGAPAETPTRVAVAAERLGYDWVAVTEHIVMPAESAPAMGARYVDSLAAIAYLAGATSTIRVLTYALVLPYRNPMVLAKGVATLDYLSGGRVILGVGAGALEREFDLLGVPFTERGQITDEYLLAMKELWTSDSPRFSGRYVRFDDIIFEPKPAQKPHPPLWIGGNTRRAIKRAVALGDGWMPWLVTPEELPAAVRFMEDQPGFAARKGSFEVILPLMEYAVDEKTHRSTGETRIPSGKDEIVDRLGRLREAGATSILVYFPKTQSFDEFSERLEAFAREIFPAFK